MTATNSAFAIQQVPHLPGSVGFPRLTVQDAHALDQGLVGLCPWAGPTPVPSIEATPAHTQDTAYARKPKLLLRRLYKPVFHDNFLAKYLPDFLNWRVPQ